MMGMGYGQGIGSQDFGMLVLGLVLPGLALLVYIVAAPRAREALLDLSFRHFLMLRIAPFSYVLSVIISGLFCLYLAYKAFEMSVRDGLLVLFVFAPLLFVVSVIWSRIVIELLVVLFRIAENTDRQPLAAGVRLPVEAGRPAPGVAPSPVSFCLQCGARREGDGKFCVLCGAAYT